MHTWNSFTKNTLFLTHTHNTYIAHTRTNFSTTGSYTHPEHIGGAYQQIWRFFTGMCARACIYTDIWGKLRGGGVTLVLSCSDRFVTEKYMYACTSTCCYYVLFFFPRQKKITPAYVWKWFVRMYVLMSWSCLIFFSNRLIFSSVSVSLRLFLSLSVCLPFSFSFSTLSLSPSPPLSPYVFTLFLSRTLCL